MAMPSSAVPLLLLLALAGLAQPARAGLFGFGARPVPAPADASEWRQYHDQDAMEAKLLQIASKCANVSRLYSIGKSVEGRDLVVIEFSATPGVHESGECGAGAGPRRDELMTSQLRFLPPPVI